jgi:serine protease Do
VRILVRNLACNLGRCALATAVACITLAGTASAQRTAAPSGWVGLSVIQSAGGGRNTGAVIEFPVVASVEPGSPAQAAGLVAGDTILAYNDVDAHVDPLALKRLLRAGAQIVVKVRRNGVRSLTVTVARRTARDAYTEGLTVSTADGAVMPLMFGLPAGPIAIAAPVAPDRHAPFAGSYLARLNSGLAGALSVSGSGVLVVDIGRGSAAMKAGLEPGDVITRADSIAVVSPIEIATAMRLASDRSIKLQVLRRGKPQEITVRW